MFFAFIIVFAILMIGFLFQAVKAEVNRKDEALLEAFNNKPPKAILIPYTMADEFRKPKFSRTKIIQAGLAESDKKEEERNQSIRDMNLTRGLSLYSQNQDKRENIYSEMERSFSYSDKLEINPIREKILNPFDDPFYDPFDKPDKSLNKKMSPEWDMPPI